MSFSRFCLFFDFVRVLKRKICFVCPLVESDVTIVFFTFLIHQSTNIDSLTVFELLILLIIQFFTSKSFRSFQRLFFLITLYLLIGIIPVKQELYKTFVGIELYLCIKRSSFFGSHTLYMKRLTLHKGLLLYIIQFHAFDLIRDFDFVCSQSNKLISQPIHADNRENGLISFRIDQIDHTPHIACLEQVLFIFLTELMTEKSKIQIRFFADTMNSNHNRSFIILL